MMIGQANKRGWESSKEEREGDKDMKAFSFPTVLFPF
jgi:hypothetical protein